jgi:hypothetical protein
MAMENNPKSRHLNVPAESNRDKHTNFLAQENGDTDPGSDMFGNLFEDTDAGEEDVDENTDIN